MNRAYYSDSIKGFLANTPDSIVGQLTRNSEFSIEPPQRDAWLREIEILKGVLGKYEGAIYIEYSIPRMGKRIDVLLLIGAVIFVLEFKVGDDSFAKYAEDQVWDYALDLKNFHETSHELHIVPILIATEAPASASEAVVSAEGDKLASPIRTGAGGLAKVLDLVLKHIGGGSIDRTKWEGGRYHPTPTIIEAAMVLYSKHSVEDIHRNDAKEINLSRTSDAISNVISISKTKNRKSICFVTGVPGAGKTLVGLNVATKHIDKKDELYSVFLSGNGPLVKILNEALARDKVQRAKERKKPIRIGKARSEVKAFIQIVHHFRDECLLDDKKPPLEHVAIFDEAQRAWDKVETASFMKRKKNRPGFNMSEPEYLISCLDRHKDWAVIVCLVGGGQEINRGEAGIGEWIESLNRAYPQWHIHISPKLVDSEYGAGDVLKALKKRSSVEYDEDLHLGVSMRSFRAENVSLLVKQLLDLDIKEAQKTLSEVSSKYPIALTRNLGIARKWLKEHARGSERYGIVVSSSAERLRPHAINVKSPMDPVHWFLDGKEDVRSSYYLEDVATEFHVQGLELDWACITWDADLRYTNQGWVHREFSGQKWNKVKKDARKRYLKNAYRVLLTRARQGMIIVVPEGDPDDPTRSPEFYDPTFIYLREVGFSIV